MDELINVRRHLHAHPEVAGEEHETTAFLSGKLAAAGMNPHVFHCGTGVWCDLDSGRPGPTVALRADIDALAMEDEKDVPYRSRFPGVAHACGHDVHTAIVYGAGLDLAPRLASGDLPGRVRLIFQPAEERVPGGAVEVIAEGTLEGVDAIYGLHCDPQLEVGRIGVRRGALTSASDFVSIQLDGPGGHTARPERTVDLIGAMGRLVVELPPRVAEHEMLLVFGSARSGQAANVIPTGGHLAGSLRARTREAWEKSDEVLERSIGEVLEDTGARWYVDHVKGVPPVVNHGGATDALAASIVDALGEDALTAAGQSNGGDDFAWYLDHVPGSYARLGVKGPEQAPLDLHIGAFDVDEGAIPIGVSALTAVAERVLLAGGIG